MTDELREVVARVIEEALVRHGVRLSRQEGTLDDAEVAISLMQPEIDRRVAEERVKLLERLREPSVDLAASLAAAISLLERGGKAAKKAAPSDKMFDQMVEDYKAALNRARKALAAFVQENSDGR